jgi:hypothetical protein
MTVQPNSAQNTSPHSKSFIIDSICRFPATGESLDTTLTILISHPTITLYRHRHHNPSQQSQKQLDANKRKCRINSITLHRMNHFPRECNTVMKLNFFSSKSKRHALDNDKEERIVNPMEGKCDDIKPERSNLPTENDANGEGCNYPCSLDKQLVW